MNWNVVLEKVETSFENGKINEAIEYLLSVVELYQNVPIFHFLLGKCYFELRDSERALYNFKIAVEGDPENWLHHYGIGHTYFMMKDYSQSVDNFLIALQLNPKNAAIYEVMASNYSHLRNYEMSMSCLTKALKVRPNSALSNLQMGNCLIDFERYAEAIPYYEKALANGNDFDQLYINLTICFFQIKDGVNGEFFFLKTIELFGPNHLIYDARGNYYSNIGDYERAMLDYHYAIDLNPEIINSYCNAGDCCHKQKNYENEKYYLDLAIEKEGIKGEVYLAMYHLPAHVFDDNEPSGFRYFLMAIQEDISKIKSVSYGRLLEIALENEAPLLFYHLLGHIYFDTPELILKRPDFNEVAHLSKPFRQQFTLWESNREVEGESSLAEALINFYMGNPIRAYQIFNERIERNGCDLCLLEQYYFILSARAIGEDEENYLQLRILSKVNHVSDDADATNTEKYYGALLLELAGNIEEAMLQLDGLAGNGYIAANYALAHFKYTLFTNDTDYDTEVLTEFLDWHLVQENYFRLPVVIRLDENEEGLVNKLLPLLQLMENKTLVENLAALRNNPAENIFEQRFFFSRYIEFTHLKELIDANALEKNNPVIFERIYGNDEERELIEPEIVIFKILEKNHKGIENIVTNLHKGAFTDFVYVNENLSLPPHKTNYRHYMALVITLHEQRLITNETLFLMQQYITYCAEAVYNISGKNEVLGYALSKIKEQIITFSLFGLSVDDLATIYSLAHNRMHGIKSEVLSYQEFIEEYKKDAIAE